MPRVVLALALSLALTVIAWGYLWIYFQSEAKERVELAAIGRVPESRGDPGPITRLAFLIALFGPGGIIGSVAGAAFDGEWGEVVATLVGLPFIALGWCLLQRMEKNIKGSADKAVQAIWDSREKVAQLEEDARQRGKAD